MTDNCFWIFVNGYLADAQNLAELIEPGNVLIAADGGAAHLRRLGRLPDLVIGDLDSIAAADLADFQAAGVEIRRFPAEKDETDLELAMSAALQMGARRIRVVAGLGGRIDQTLANLMLLLRPELDKLDVRMEDGETEAFVIRSRGRVDGGVGDTVSLLPLLGLASGIVTEGLRYPLHLETLYPHQTRGVSNELQQEQAEISLQTGVLLCVHIRVN